MTPSDLFRLTKLEPIGTKDGGHGICSCGNQGPLYRKGTGKQAVERCDVCTCLSQSYTNPPGKSPSRMVDGSYFLITRKRIDFWGNHLINRINPDIHCHAAAGAMREVKKGLLLSPPDPPWMFIQFAKAPVTARSLVLTEDNKVIRFSGKTTLDDRISERVDIHEVNRAQVMALLPVGMDDREWHTYLAAYANGSAESFTIMEQMREKYPALAKVRHLPLLDSPEHIALTLLLRRAKGTAKEAA